MTEDEAQDWLRETLDVSRETLDKLARYRTLVLEGAEEQNLIARSTFDVFWTRHIVDSAQLLPLASGAVDGDWLDLGAGERRWRAAQRAHLHQVPVIVKQFDDRTALEIALVENIQREELNAWEEGETYRRLIEEYGHSQEELGRIVGKSRSHIANLMRLRNLPMRVHGWLVSGEISMGHARALLQCEDPEGIAKQVIERGLSVRDTERLAKRAKAGAKSATKARGGRDPDLEALERQLGDILGLKVQIAHGARGGTVTLGYSSLDQLDLICQRLSGEHI